MDGKIDYNCKENNCRRLRTAIASILKPIAYKKYGKITKEMSKFFANTFYGTKLPTEYDDYLTTAKLEHELNEDPLFRLCKKMDENKKATVKRYREAIDEMIEIAKVNDKFAVRFATITFKDETLKKTSMETRRRYVARLLKEKAIYYIANIDFGKEHEREHYHAVILTTSKAKTKINDKYGYTNCKNVRLNDCKSSTRIAKYITKLKLHCQKATTNNEKLLYGRKQLLSVVYDAVAIHKIDVMP